MSGRRIAGHVTAGLRGLRWRTDRNNTQFYTDHFWLNVAWQKARHDELVSLVRSLPKMIGQ